MNKEPDNRDLAQQVELLKKDYEIMEAKIDATLHQMRADIERAQKAQTWWIIGVGLGLGALFLGVAAYLG